MAAWLLCLRLVAAFSPTELDYFAGLSASDLATATAGFNTTALTSLGELLLLNTSSYANAYCLLNRSAAMGDSAAFYPLGFMYLYRLTELVEGRPAVSTALTYYYFAALDGDVRALLALAYRHLKGLDMPNNCEAACAYYEVVARKVVEEQIEGRYVLLTEQKRLIHPWGGDYGSSDEEEILIEEFTIQHYADEIPGKLAKAYRHYYGHRGYSQDLAQAAKLYQEAADLGSHQAKAALGEMYLIGRGIPQNLTRAFDLFNEASAFGVAKAKTGLGYMYLMGLGVEVDHHMGSQYIQQAALAGDPNAVFNLGVLYLLGEIEGPASPRKAFQNFNSAMHYGHTMAGYHLALMHKHELDLFTSCISGANLFKMIAERGVHSSTLKTAHELYASGDMRGSAMRYLQAADQGYEVAQVNAAYLFETQDLMLHALEVSRRMLELATEQKDVGSVIRLGDYYYYGIGVETDLSLAFAYYTRGRELRSPQAMFNLGYMYHYGEGVSKDPYLAKRYYDQAVSESQTFNAPANLMLFLLLHEVEWADLLLYAEMAAVLLASLCVLKLI
jgi:SEL1 protein